MGVSEKLVPKRRFKEFVNNGAWEQRKFSELTDIRSASRVHKEEWKTEGVPFYRSSDVMSALNESTNEKAFISEELYEKLSAISGRLGKGDILVTGGGSVGKPYIVPDNQPLYTKDADLLWVKANENLDPYFIYIFFFSPGFRDHLSSVSHIGTIAHYTITQLGNTPIILPKVAEQKQIGQFFTNLDNLITLHQRKLEKIKALKSAYLSEMFPVEGENKPKRRFVGFTEDWEQRKLKQLANFAKGQGYTKNDLKDVGTPIILYGRLYTKYESTISEVDTFAVSKIGSVYSTGEEVIVPASGETAEDIARASAIVKSGILLGGDLNIIYPNKDISNVFLALSISNGKLQKELSKKAQGKSVVHLHNSDLEDVTIPYPCREEQERIGSVFANLDNLITLQQQKLEKLQNIKKAFLNELFI